MCYCCDAQAMTEMGQTVPPSFVAATAELTSIADVGKASRPSTASIASPGGSDGRLVFRQLVVLLFHALAFTPGAAA